MDQKTFDQNISDTADLILAYLRGKLSPQDKKKLDKWLSENKENPSLLRSFEDAVSVKKDIDFFSSIEVQRSLEKIKSITGQTPKSFWQRNSLILKTAGMIILIIASAITGYHRFQSSASFEAAIPNSQSKEITPGGNRASLELANGSTILLEAEGSRMALKDHGVRIDRNEGVIYYNIPLPDESTETSYNRISTPKGGKYQVVLPDGSRVWLNSESSLRFPITLRQKERTVELTGEAYFEVAKMKNKPFKVLVKDVTVEALGTRFNIMSYGNESTIKTTLLEGSIKVSKGFASKLVIPGQQVEIKDNLSLIDKTNIEEAIAWKTGVFEFDNSEIKSISRQLERWYCVHIDYTKDISTKRFSGTIPRDTHIKVLLEMLKEAGINYKIEERRVFLF